MGLLDVSGKELAHTVLEVNVESRCQTKLEVPSRRAVVLAGTRRKFIVLKYSIIVSSIIAILSLGFATQIAETPRVLLICLSIALLCVGITIPRSILVPRKNSIYEYQVFSRELNKIIGYFDAMELEEPGSVAAYFKTEEVRIRHKSDGYTPTMALYEAKDTKDN